MWRIFRLGIKSSNCPGNQTHFRIIGTTCANADCEDKVDEPNDLSNKENYDYKCCSGLASKAAKQHLNFLSQSELSKVGADLSSKFKSSPISYQPNKLKAVDNSLKEIQWDQYVKQRTKVLSGSEKSKESQNIPKQSKKKRKSSKDKKDLKSKLGNFSHEPFGALAEAETGRTNKFDKVPDDPEDLVDPLKETYEERLSAHGYGRKMLQLCRERKLKEALEVLEVEMKAAGVPPDNYCYNVLISGCGKAGYTQKAFYLYRGMKQRGLEVEKFAYTGLFNACANSPFKLTEGLELARRLRASIKEKDVPLHPITYHAMIKAFGHCGDIETAFEVADEMLEKQHVLTTDTMNFLLQACITDKESGFRHALMVWRKMRALGITPCIYSYNLLLRCVKECHAGDPTLLSQLLEAPAKEHIPRKLLVKPGKTLKPPKEKDPVVVVEDQTPSSPVNASEMERGVEATQTTGATRSVSQISDKNEVVKVELAENMELEIVTESCERRTEPCDVLPNVLSRKFRPGKVIGISSLETKEERLALLAGVGGVLSNMKEDDVTPSITSFTFFLESLPTNTEAEESLLSVMEAQKVIPDVIFCNKLIHRRGMRKQFDDAKEVLELMQKHHVSPDLVTFGCLALAASKVSQMRALLGDMEKSGFTPSEEIMRCLIKGSMAIREYAFTLELLRRMNSLEMTPSERTLTMLEEGRRKVKQNMVKQELESRSTPLTERERTKRDEMNLFILEYNNWLKKSCVELDEHPWVQYGYKKTTTSVATASV